MTQNNPGQILIVDDEPNLRRTLQIFLEKSGYRVLTADSGVTALDLLKHNKFVLAFVDLMMPGISGLELISKIRTKYPHIAILILTAYGSLDSAVEAVRSGARDYLIKPVDPTLLVHRVDSLMEELNRPRLERELIGQIQTLLQDFTHVNNHDPVGLTITQPHASVEDDRIWHHSVLYIDSHARKARLGNHYLNLTQTTFNYLATLANHYPDTISYPILVLEAQGYELDSLEAKEMSRWHIHQLRKAIRLVDPSFKYVITMRGEGYRLALP